MHSTQPFQIHSQFENDKKQYSQVFCFGSAQCDQFQIKTQNPDTKEEEEIYECKKPYCIPEFLGLKLKISQIACGAMHNLVLTNQGEVYSWGNNDSLQLGRDCSPKNPRKVDLETAVDFITAGEVHSTAANSKTGWIYIWGKFKSPEKVIFQTQEIISTDYYQFKKQGIQDIKSGLNHLLILSGHWVYVFGDKSIGALGNQFKNDEEQSRVDLKYFTSVALRSVSAIYTTYYSSFIITEYHSKKKGTLKKVYGFGLNNWGQLGVKTDQFFQMLPKEWKTFDGNKIKEIAGGEHHTLFLLQDGSLLGAGRNDDGQLGDCEPTEIGTLQQLTHIKNVDKIYSAQHYNYAKQNESLQYFAWGFGADFVLANGQEDSLFKARPVNPERVFTHAPLAIALGSNHVAYVSEILAQFEGKLKLGKKRMIKMDDLFVDKDNHKKVG